MQDSLCESVRAHGFLWVLFHQRGDRRHLGTQPIGHLAPLHARRAGIVLHEGRADEGRQRHAIPGAFFTASLTAALYDRTFLILDIGTPLLLGRNLCLRLFRCGAFSAA
jgi:hypothetical protein